jgi:hypothetical protein
MRRRQGKGDRKVRKAHREHLHKVPDPDDPKVRQGCTRKIRSYRSKHWARAAARAASKKHGVEFKFYRCRYCSGGFHLTTVKPVVLPEMDVVVKVASAPSEPTLRSLVGTRTQPMVRMSSFHAKR